MRAILFYAITMSKKFLTIPFLSLLIFLSPRFCAAAENVKSPVTPENKLSISVNQYGEDIPFEIYSQWTKHTPTMSVNSEYASEIENPNFCPIKNTPICQLLFSQGTASHFQIRDRASVDQEEIKSYLEDLARRTDSEASDAKFKVENGKVSTFAPEQKGSKLDLEASLKLIADFFQNDNSEKITKTFELPYKTSAPLITTGEANNMGITTLIGEGKSNFKGSPRNRIHNINAALKRFDGVLIKPGEEFSFVSTLGEVDEDHGYLPELVIKRGKTEPEFGGGICQVSTTVFRAAIYSGLEITARRNHAYPVSYYNPQGMDSTIYIPKPDLRFKNNTPGYILIQSSVEGSELTFSFYGTDDGRKVEVEGPRIIESNPDKSIKTTFSQKVTAKDGSIIINDTFNSSYESPYKYPHPGDVMLAQKPANWSDEEWKAYKSTFKEMTKALENPPKSSSKR